MKTIEIKGKLREKVGKKDTKKSRAKGLVPCVIYGGGENIHFEAPENDFRHLIYTPDVYITHLDIDGKKIIALLKDMQFHPVSEKILHLDFQQVSEDKKIIIGVPIHLTGVSPGVKEGGKLKLEARRIKVRALMEDLPDFIEVNIDNLLLGKSIKAGELSLGKLELLDSTNTVIASVKLTRAAQAGTDLEDEEGEEGEEGEESGDGEATEGGDKSASE